MFIFSCKDAWRPAVVATFALATVSCGDGGGSPTPPPTINSPPVISTADQNLSVTENGTGVLFTVAVSDADGDTIRFSLVGDDAGDFTIDAAGQVSFRAAPNFDLPVDGNRDNTYGFAVLASDGTAADRLEAVVRVTNDKEGVAVTRIATGFVDPVAMDWGNAANALVIAERGGTVYSVDGTTGARTPVANQPVMGAGGEIVTIAFDRINTVMPGLVVMTRSATGIDLQRPGASIRQDASLANGDPQGAGGALAFDENGMLYAAVGDPDGTRAQGDSGYGRFFEPNHGGASLRGIPIRAVGYGVRQPGGLLKVGNFMWLGDQGGSVQHEISFFLTDQRPINFNWPFYEGTVLLANGGPAQPIQPSVTYPFGTDRWQGTGIVFGRNYAGPIASLNGKFVFGDRDGSIYTIATALVDDGTLHGTEAIERRNEDFAPDAGAIERVVAIRVDGNGVLYILDADGELFRVDQS